ncbi:coiled-coil domain-containing protein 183-like [Pezoporus flaviventris]|uniref:coiled-coil domain-containing protein 183-like n=1 Tax=Pezoporus flaviventris TaxID=889875 RepID=UPI002AAF9E40|nr:coiled-coil domain-containing protein 183-like [Pezoporus flaviventris]XP_061326672.1 coiled-coil domain-containing protein 183-like [Pezoporus flaviventris]
MCSLPFFCPQHELTIAEACGAEQPLGIALASKPLEVAQEKLRAEVCRQVNTCNMLLYQVEQRSRAKERLQRRLQQLQDVQRAEKQQQAQVVRTLEGNIEKMQTKVRAGQKVTALYVAVRDALRKELAHLPLHLDLLSETAELQHREVEDMELMASRGLRAARGAEERMVRTKTQVLAERELRLRTQAAQKEPRDGGWLKEAKERALKTQAKHDLSRDFLSLPAEDPVVAAKLEATKYQLQREAYVREKIEEAKDVVQCSRLWDIPIRLQAQQKSLLEMEQYLTRCKEKKQELEKAVKELEMQRDELKFRRPPDTSRCCWPPDTHAKGAGTLRGRGTRAWGLVEELRTRLQREEARLEQGRAQLLRSQETLLDFENALDNLFVRLRGITVPGQEHPVKAMAVDEKLRQCEQKLQYLVQRVADLPPSSHSEDDETFVKVRQLLEETLMADPRNRKVSLEDTGVGLQDDFDIPDNHSGLVLTREAIKKQGLDLIESKKKSKRNGAVIGIHEEWLREIREEPRSGSRTAVAAAYTAGLESRGRSSGIMLGQKTNLSKRIREMRASIALQGQARNLYSKPQEEKFTQNVERLPQLREAVQEDIYVLGLARKS